MEKGTQSAAHFVCVNQPDIHKIFSTNLCLNPLHNYPGKIFLLFISKFNTCFKPVPFFYTASAAAGSSMLCDKDRMVAQRCLLPVIFYHRRSYSFFFFFFCMLPYCLKPLAFNIDSVLFLELKTASEF